MAYKRHPTESEMAEAQAAFDKWRIEHGELAAERQSRAIFYHGYLTRVIETKSKDT